MTARLVTSVEVAALIRRCEQNGDFATVIRKGDDDRGAILILLSSRGAHIGCFERALTMEGAYRWASVGPGLSAESREVADFLAKRARFDDDMWAIELDTADPERFIAETLASP
jgi:hypothetical protein